VIARGHALRQLAQETLPKASADGQFGLAEEITYELRRIIPAGVFKIEKPQPVVETPEPVAPVPAVAYARWLKWALPTAATVLLIANSGMVIETFASFVAVPGSRSNASSPGSARRSARWPAPK
jgi:hypothetical protein